MNTLPPIKMMNNCIEFLEEVETQDMILTSTNGLHVLRTVQANRSGGGQHIDIYAYIRI